MRAIVVVVAVVVLVLVVAVVMDRGKVAGLEARFAMDSRRRDVDVVDHGLRWLSVVLDRLLDGLGAVSDEWCLFEAGVKLRPQTRPLDCP